MNLRALWLRFVDLANNFGAPPYAVMDREAYSSTALYYDLEKALRAADESEPRRLPSGGRVYPVAINGTEFFFTVDKLGRRHLPRALRERML